MIEFIAIAILTTGAWAILCRKFPKVRDQVFGKVDA